MSRRAAAAEGFFLGSVVTIAVAYGYYHYFGSATKQSNAETVVAGGETTQIQQARSLLTLEGAKKSVNSSAYATISNLERTGFLSDIVAQLWSHINVAGSAMIKDIVEPIFKEVLPGPLSTTRFTKIDLGKVPIKFDNIVVHDIKDGAVQFDVDLHWVTDCDIQLKADYVGNFGVKSVVFKGRLSFLLKPLTNELPVVSAIQYAFINPPDLELDFTGLAQVADFKVIDKTIRNVIQDVIAGMMVLPNRMLFKVDSASDYLSIYQPPVGFARVTAVKGHGFEVEKRALRKDDIPDVYCNVSLGGKLWRTSTIKNSLTPAWNESADFLLSDHDQIVSVHAWDEDTGALDGDDDLGIAKVTVGEILLAGKTATLELLKEDKGTGAFVALHCDVCALTPDLGSFETSRGKNMNCGLLGIVVTRAFDIPLQKEKAASFVKIVYGENEFLTGTVTDYPGVDALNPIYDSVFHVLLTAEMMAKGDGAVVLNLMNGETILGTTTVTHASLVDSPDKTITERRKMGSQGSSLEFRVYLCGMLLPKGSPSKPAPGPTTTITSSAPAASQKVVYVSSQAPVASGIGTVRVTAVKGRGFKIQKKRLKRDDIPDVYCKIMFGSSPKVWRTATIPNNTTPAWNESSDFLLSDHGQIISIEAYDEDKGSRDADDRLGSARIAVGKLLLAGGIMDVELQQAGTPTGEFITLRCDLVNA
jgi:Ca2+-dependent lipid-binding protein